MADTPAPPAADTDTPEQQGEPVNWGRILDAAGVLAGIALALIVADIISDGRLISRRLPQRRPRQEDPVDSD